MRSMMTLSRFPFRRLAIDGLYVCCFNVLCAILVTYVFGNGRNFGASLVISMCIGTIAWLLIDGTRLLAWGEVRPVSWPKFLLLLAIAVPVASVLGSELGGWLIGVEISMLGAVGSNRPRGPLLFTLFATGIVTSFFVYRDRLAQARAEAAVEKARAEIVERQALQAQLQLLQAQIEPHMLFNTLANVQGLIALDPARAQVMLDQLIQYLRATLSASRADRTTLQQEFALLDAYLGLMSVRMGARLSYTLELPDTLKQIALPPMLLQPLVENAIAHGLEPAINGGHVQISALAADGRLELAVADSGCGTGAGPGKPGTGLGLTNLRERLRALYGERAAFVFESAPQGTVARIILPCELP